ncbi:hypothetical protein HMPREF1867_00087 [Veillonella dispar]|nr:hypothetical protein HMPREF1867_00087 [Veillonella dispar]
MKRSSLVWYVAVACLGGSLCVGSVVQADSPKTVKASSIVPTTVTTQMEQAALKQNSNIKLKQKRWDCYGCVLLRSIER